MKLFFAFVVLAFMSGLILRRTRSEGLVRLCLVGLCVALAIGYYAFHKL